MRLVSLLGLLACLALVGVVSPVVADTNANCTYSDFLGHWNVWSVAPGYSAENCTAVLVPNAGQPNSGFTLVYPNIAKRDDGAIGNWTLIYNQGVDIWFADEVNFFFAAYDDAGNSFCDRSLGGFRRSRTDTTDANCFYAQRSSQQKHIRLTEDKFESRPRPSADRLYHHPADYLAAVNAAQNWFTVKRYPEFEQMTIADLQRMRGGSHPAVSLEQLMPTDAKTGAHHKPSHKKKPHPHSSIASGIPEAFDWRNVSGVNFVSPVRAQGSCGSCYSFASAGMMEARVRVASGNQLTPVFATQEIVSCSPYSQSCEGGFPYLVAGKYGHDFGLVEEACYPYTGNETACSALPTPLPEGCSGQRWMTGLYYYIGGYYGQSTPELMQEEILANGPIAVSFNVYPDFQNYAGGVYTHQFTHHLDALANSYNPFHLTNHVVVIVGWGVTEDENATPYWIVKNSWGTQWGENGFFRILRGSSEAGGECAIESLTVSAIPILNWN